MNFYDRNYKHLIPNSAKVRLIKVLDYGSGDGSFGKWAKSQGHFFNAEITEYDPIHNSQYWETFLEQHKNEFDLVICKEVLYYFAPRELSRAFKAIMDTLKPGGTAIFQVFNPAILTGNWPWMKDSNIANIVTEKDLRVLAFTSGDEFVSITGERVGVTLAIIRFAWFSLLRMIYVIERGRCPGNPNILSKALIMVVKKK